MNCYESKAQATKARRRAAGYYATLPQQAAMAKWLRRGGVANLDKDDCIALSTHPFLTVSQREYFANLVATL